MKNIVQFIAVLAMVGSISWGEILPDILMLKHEAEQGGVAAQYNLGIMYYSGEGVLADYVEAYAW